MRDLNQYINNFDNLPFETTQARYRRKSFLLNIEGLPTFKNVLEVGCGESSVFEFKEFDNCLIVEPISEFISRLKGRINYNGIRFQNSTLEEFSTNEKFDLIVASCILHEIEDPTRFLNSIFDKLADGGYLYIDVPNARSLHRFFAVATGFLPDIYAETTTQNNMQQSTDVFDKAKLKLILKKCGFKVNRIGGYFLKPFHHARMQHLVDQGIFSDSDLDGLYKIAENMQDFESEIFAICKKDD